MAKKELKLGEKGVEDALRFTNKFVGSFDDMLPDGYRLQRLRDRAKKSGNPILSTFAQKQEVG